MLVLDINDAEIALLRDGETLYREPGVALVDADGATFGLQAQQQCRLHPRQAHNEFWQRMNADPVAPSGKGVANQADLVYLHLTAIRQAAQLPGGSEVAIAAPSAVDPRQLAMLLGIMAEAGFNARAIVDSAVAAASRAAFARDSASSMRLLDITLHRAVVTQLERSTDAATPTLRRSGVDEVAPAGLAALAEGWVDAVADRFVEDTRFDPLRIAATEQQVFDQVLAGIALGGADLDIEVAHREVARRISVARRVLAEKAEQRYALLGQAIGAPTVLAITHRVRDLPGLAAYLQAAGHDIVPLPRDAAAEAIHVHAELIAAATQGSGAQLIAALPLGEGVVAHERPPAQPTHLLCGAVALPLGDTVKAEEHPGYSGGAPLFGLKRGSQGFVLAPHPGAEVHLNGARVEFEHAVAAGDRIVCGHSEFRLITVVDPA